MIRKINNKIKRALSESIYFVKDKFDTYGELDYNKGKFYMFDSIRTHSYAKEPETVRWIETFNKKDIAYDIGANVGAYSLIMSKYSKEVYAFEPAFFNFNILLKNIIYNCSKGTIDNNIVPLDIALSDKTSLGEFNYASLKNGSALHVLDGNIDYVGKEFTPVFKQKIISFSIDDLIKYFKLPLPTRIKLDVDGNEYKILHGAKKTLLNKNLYEVLTEIGIGFDEKKVVNFMDEYGFKLVEKNMHGQTKDVGNYLFRRK